MDWDARVPVRAGGVCEEPGRSGADPIILGGQRGQDQQPGHRVHAAGGWASP